MGFDELEVVAVACVDKDFIAFLGCFFGDGAANVIGFDAMAFLPR